LADGSFARSEGLGDVFLHPAVLLEIESAKPALLAPVAVGVAHSSERLLETGATLQQRTKL
jgi:hypothetical protein